MTQKRTTTTTSMPKSNSLEPKNQIEFSESSNNSTLKSFTKTGRRCKLESLDQIIFLTKLGKPLNDLILNQTRD